MDRWGMGWIGGIGEVLGGVDGWGIYRVDGKDRRRRAERVSRKKQKTCYETEDS